MKQDSDSLNYEKTTIYSLHAHASIEQMIIYIHIHGCQQKNIKSFNFSTIFNSISEDFKNHVKRFA